MSKIATKTPLRNEWMLLALKLAGVDGLTSSQLQKSIFLLQKTFNDRLGNQKYDFFSNDFLPYVFIPSDYGPACRSMEDDISYFKMKSFIIESFDKVDNRVSTYPTIRISSKGEKFLQDIFFDKSPRNYLKKVVNWTKEVTFHQMISAICTAYPEMAVNSVFWRAKDVEKTT